MFRSLRSLRIACVSAALAVVTPATRAADAPPAIPRFSTAYLDRAADPAMDFFQFATGTWRKNNPVPADKARWAGFDELQERNWWLIRSLLDELAAAPGGADATRKLVGDFYASAMDTNRLEKLAFSPLDGDLARIPAIQSVDDAMELLANWHARGIGASFGAFFSFGP